MKLSPFQKKQNAFLQRDSISGLFPQEFYDKETKLFYLSDGTVARCWEAMPSVGSDEQMQNMLNSCFNKEMPEDTFIGFNNISSSFIDLTVQHYRNVRANLMYADDGLTASQKALLKGHIDARSAMLMNGKKDPLNKANKVLLKDMNLIVWMKIPAEELIRKGEVDKLLPYFNTLEAAITTAGLKLKPIDNRQYVYILRGLGYMGEYPDTYYDENKEINKQLFDFESSLHVEKDHLKWNNHYVKTMSVQEFPEECCLPIMDQLLGDPKGSANQIHDPFIISGIFHYPNQQKEIAAFNKKYQGLNYQADGKFGNMVELLKIKQQGYRALSEGLNKGEQLVNYSFNLMTFSPTLEKAEQTVTSVKTFWNIFNFKMREDSYFMDAVWWASLPMNVSKEYIKTSQRFHPMCTSHLVTMLPILGEWPGTGSGGSMPLVSRRGQLMLFDLFDGTSYNAIIAAETGAGKSFLANDIICHLLSQGVKVRVVDQGYSYQKIVELLDGEFIEFSDETQRNNPICLNPFTNIKDIDAEIEQLVIIVGKMACPQEGITDTQFSVLEKAILMAWNESGPRSSITTIQEMLELIEEEGSVKKHMASELALQINRYTRHGAYGEYFEGKNNLDYNSNLVCLELQSLESMKMLQKIVLLLLIQQIGRECYDPDNKSRYVVILDESWQHLDDPDVGKFMQMAYRTFRKFGAGIVIITQSLFDLTDSAHGRPLVANSEKILVMQQRPTVVKDLAEKKHLAIGDWGFDLLKGVHSVTKGPERYSEIMVISGSSFGIGRLMVDRYTQLLYSTNKDELNQISEIAQSRGISKAEAIKVIVNLESGLDVDQALADVNDTKPEIEGANSDANKAA